MAEIIGGEFKRNELNAKSMGGTEVLTMKLAERANKDLLKECQIVSSRIKNDLDGDKIRIFWAHDLPGDPESDFLKTQYGKDKFHKFVFVSNWQMQNYINAYNLPWSKCIVLRNFIDPIEEHDKPNPNEQINLIYHTTPHRGLNILSAVFEKLCEKHKNLHLDVYSSFALYGWEQRDKEYAEVFKRLESNSQVTNHGTKSNDEIRDALKKSHIFAYPSIWQETSCLSLMEAMSSKNLCVHSNYGSLYETASHWTNMYQYYEDLNSHAGAFYNMLDLTIENYKAMYANAGPTKVYTDTFYSWSNREAEWNSLLSALVNSIQDRSLPEDRGEIFSYSTG